ncbi:MAG: glutaredoxin domain-containing protein [Bacteroidales bacterium]|jgi:glutaredoxin-like YruB-family protein
MNLQSIASHSEMLTFLKESQRTYVLLYRKGSEASDCSYHNIEKALDQIENIHLVAADVTTVRDIHEHYPVTSVPSLLVFEGQQFTNVVKGCNDDGFYKSLFESALFSAKAAENGTPQKKVTVYSTPSCSWCNTLKTHLKKNGVRFTDVDVSRDEKAAEAMVKRSGQQGVPQTDINGEMIVGFDKTRINTLLGIQ